MAIEYHYGWKEPQDHWPGFTHTRTYINKYICIDKRLQVKNMWLACHYKSISVYLKRLHGFISWYSRPLHCIFLTLGIVFLLIFARPSVGFGVLFIPGKRNICRNNFLFHWRRKIWNFWKMRRAPARLGLEVPKHLCFRRHLAHWQQQKAAWRCLVRKQICSNLRWSLWLWMVMTVVAIAKWM